MLKQQLSAMFHGKGFRAAFLISMICVVVFFFMALPMPYGEINGLYAYCGIGDCNEWSMYSFLLSFLLVLPFATSFQDDLQKKVYGGVMIRGTRSEYIKSKMIATFIGNFVMVVIPFLINLILCLIFLPDVETTPYGEEGSELYRAIMNGTGVDYSSACQRQPLVGVIEFNPTMYCVFFLIILGLFCGFAGVVVLAVSFWVRKNKIALFLPFLLISQGGETWTGISLNKAIADRTHTFFNLSIWDYVAPFSFTGKVYWLFIVFILLLGGFVYISYRHIMKIDYLELME